MDPNSPPPGNSETFLTEPVYIFDLEAIPCPPGTPAAPRPADRPRIIPDPSEPLDPVIVIFEDRPQPPAQ